MQQSSLLSFPKHFKIASVNKKHNSLHRALELFFFKKSKLYGSFFTDRVHEVTTNRQILFQPPSPQEF